MDDDNNKFDRPKSPRGTRPAGGRGPGGEGKSFGGGRSTGKPGGKSFGKPSGKTGGRAQGRSFGDKPAGARFSKDGPRNRDFARGDRPEGERAERSFRKGPRPDGERPRFEGKRSFSKEGREERPFRARREDAVEGGAQRRREFTPRDGGRDRAEGDRPFRKPREFTPRDGERANRSEGPADRGVPRDGDARGERSFDKQHSQRPRRFERGEQRQAGGDKPRSFGMKRHAEARSDGGQRPRSYGQKTHGDYRGGDAPRTRRQEAVEESGERIAKRLARAGIASRREAEDLVSAGRVRVNGQVLSSPAFNVGPDDRIELDGTEIPAIERTRLFLFHKPAGVVTTNRDPEGRKTVFDVLPADLPRLMTVGRLDINTEGLLLLTNDGGLARVLELPTTGWLRRYRVRVHGEVDEKALAGLKDGIAVDGVFYGAIEASLERVQGTNAWLTVGLREGKNREVKNVLGALGLEVTRLIRVSFGPFQLGELPEGHVQELKGRTLRDQLGERLIEEAGANFDAPVTKPFSKASGSPRRTEEHPVRSVRSPASLPLEPGEGGLIKNRKRRREDARDDALGRLSTRPERGGFGFRSDKPGSGARGAKPGFGGKRSEGPRDKEAEKPRPGQRKSNVWMAPGARPQGEGRAAPKGKPAASKGGGRFSGDRQPSSRRPGDGKGPRGPRKG